MRSPGSLQTITVKNSQLVLTRSAVVCNRTKNPPPVLMPQECCIIQLDVVHENVAKRPIEGERSRSIQFYGAITACLRDHIYCIAVLKYKRVRQVVGTH